MTEHGWSAFNRAIWSHPMFAPEPFTEREAWVWLFSSAAHKTKRVRAGRVTVELKRGQLCFAMRFLAEKWKWSESAVRRFTKRLETDGMVTLEPSRDATLITICNYDKHQFGRRTEDAQPDGQTDEPAANRRRKEEEINKERIDDDEEDARAKPLISAEANELADEVAKIAGHSPDFIPPSWFGAPYRAQIWLNQGWSKDLILLSVREQSARKRDGPPSKIEYFEKGIASAISRHQAPLPTVKVIEGQTIEVTREKAGTGGSSSVIDASERLIERVRDLTRPAAICGPEGADVVRMLPQGGRERS